MSDEMKKCGNCGKELGRNLWGWCSSDCLRAIAERHAPDAVRALGLKVELNSLRAELEAVKNEWNADKARLDWLSTIDGADWFLYCDCGGLTREAIDAAIAESKAVSGRDGTAEGLMW